MLQQMGFLWAVAAIVWGGTLCYAISLVRRQRHLQNDLEQLQSTLERLEKRS